MPAYHFELTLYNPKFKEEKGVTVDAKGEVIAFRNSKGEGRMLHVRSCQPIPVHAGLHSVTAAHPRCKACVAMQSYFLCDPESFNVEVAKGPDAFKLDPK